MTLYPHNGSRSLQRRQDSILTPAEDGGWIAAGKKILPHEHEPPHAFVACMWSKHNPTRRSAEVLISAVRGRGAWKNVVISVLVA